MDLTEDIVSGFERLDIDLVAYIPDSVLAAVVRSVEDHPAIDTVRVAREEEAVGILSGAWLTGRRGALLCQTSGLANSFNALGSVSKPTRLPFVAVVTHRGGLGDHNLAHSAAEYPMPRLLDTIGIRNYCLQPGDDAETVTGMAGKTAFSQEEPFVILLEPTVTEGDR